MKTTIYWFSGTGNSLAVAKQLAAGLRDAQLVPITRVTDVEPEGRVGLVFPVYAFGPPTIVKRFVDQLELRPDTPIFSVCTCAVTPGDTAGIVRRLLRKKGLDLSSAWTVRQPENYPPLGGTPGPRSQARTHNRARQKVDEILQALQSPPSRSFEQANGLLRAIAKFVWPLFRAFVEKGKADRFFCADQKCVSCGLCAEVCPALNIQIVDGRPAWQGHCEQCFACFHWCPQKAIQYGASKRLRRYHHPDSLLNEIREQGHGA